MTRPLSRRKYAALVKFLRSVLNHPKATLPQKLRAAERLDAIYERHEAAELRREEREARAQTATPAPTTADTETPAPVSPEDALREAQAFLERMKQKETAAHAQ